MKKSNIIVLGAGRVGSAIALDLGQNNNVTVFDISQRNLDAVTARNFTIKTYQRDLNRTQDYNTWLKDADIVVCAVPGFMGYKTLEAIIEAGKNVVDISFFPEDALLLNYLAVKKGVTAIVDCGVAPGLSNIVLGHHDSYMTVDFFECYVGGLPIKRVKPFEYKAPFSPIDVLEEYTRPARLVENGNVTIKPALSEIELMDIDPVGSLESFNTDGLRSLLKTMSHIPNMKEKTLRYPGHAELMKTLYSTGLLEGNIETLFEKWHLGEEDADFTIMKMMVEGKLKDGTYSRTEYILYDEYDSTQKIHSMSRTTGYTCTAAVNLVLQGMFTRKGLMPAEYVGADKTCFHYILGYLAERNIKLKITKS